MKFGRIVVNLTFVTSACSYASHEKPQDEIQDVFLRISHNLVEYLVQSKKDREIMQELRMKLEEDCRTERAHLKEAAEWVLRMEASFDLLTTRYIEMLERRIEQLRSAENKQSRHPSQSKSE